MRLHLVDGRDEAHASVTDSRRQLLARGLVLEAATIAWNLLEGVVAVTAGILAGSVALLGFGIDSFVEAASAVVVGWRLREELRGRSLEQTEQLERRASQIAGGFLLVLALYLLIDAGRRLLGFGKEAEESIVGIVLTALSLGVMPLLGWAKLRTAARLGSSALRADAYETITCAWLSLTTLLGLGLNALFGWWWADPVAAVIFVPLIVREGLEGLRAEPCCTAG